MNAKQLQAFLTAGAEGHNPYAEAQAKGMQADRNVERLKKLLAIAPEGSSVHSEGASIGQDPMAKLMQQGPKEGQAFLKNAQSSYKGINDQLDAAKATIDALNQGNAAADKMALINEARIAAGQGGSRAIAHLVDLLSGGSTAQGTFQDKLNWLQNTPNIPTMQPAHRDAIREAVFMRLPQLEQMHQQASSQLLQQGAVTAPHADYGSITKSLTTPVQQKLDDLKKMSESYQTQRSKLGPKSVSSPSEADANPTTLDKLKSLLGGLKSPARQPSAAAPAPAGPTPPPSPQQDEAAEFANFYNNVYKKMKQNAPGQSAPPTTPGQ